MYHLLRTGCRFSKHSNIIFVCGGLQAEHMRAKFELAFSDILPKYQFVKPEDAMQTYHLDGPNTPLDLGVFERTLGGLSAAIVLFPEAPGSYAEAGYFSQIPDLRTKTLAVFDSNFQGTDSFLSIGPGLEFERRSYFRPIIQMDYKNPNFGPVAKKIREKSPLSHQRQARDLTKMRFLSDLDLHHLLLKLVDLCRIATYTDIEFLIRGLFGNSTKPKRLKQAWAILSAIPQTRSVGEFGHRYCAVNKPSDGHKGEERALRLAIASTIQTAPADFRGLVPK